MNKRKSKRPTKTCFNPFSNDPACTAKLSDLRPFPVKDLYKFPDADETSKLCTSCRKRVASYEAPTELTTDEVLSQASASLTLTPASGSTTSNFSDSLKDYDDHSLENLLRISPVKKRRLDRPEYFNKKFDEIHAAVNAKIHAQFGILPQTSSDELLKDYESMINNVKRIYEVETNRSFQLKLLTILPESWSLYKVVSEMNCSKSTAYAARNAGETCLRIRGNQPLDREIEQLVTNFYEDDLNSRQMAGMRDVKSVKKSDGTRELKQKRLILINLRELYASFKTEYPAAKIQFSKFAGLRPQHCVIAGSSGTHTVCVCITHQNMKLMLEGIKFSTLIENNDWIQKSNPIYANLLKKLCDEPSELCYNRLCKKCPDSHEMKQFF